MDECPYWIDGNILVANIVDNRGLDTGFWVVGTFVNSDNPVLFQGPDFSGCPVEEISVDFVERRKATPEGMTPLCRLNTVGVENFNCMHTGWECRTHVVVGPDTDFDPLFELLGL